MTHIKLKRLASDMYEVIDTSSYTVLFKGSFEDCQNYCKKLERAA